MGSDGLYDKFSSHEVITFIKNQLNQMAPSEMDLSKAVRNIANECIFAKNVKDNVTIILIALNRGEK